MPRCSPVTIFSAPANSAIHLKNSSARNQPPTCIAALRPAFAQLAYIRDHAGQPPSDPAALQPYLSRPFDAAMALREMKLKWDGEHLTMSYNWTK